MINTVKDLKEELNKFDENLEIGGVGHFGERLMVNSVSYDDDTILSDKFVVIDIDEAGQEPE